MFSARHGAPGTTRADLHGGQTAQALSGKRGAATTDADPGTESTRTPTGSALGRQRHVKLYEGSRQASPGPSVGIHGQPYTHSASMYIWLKGKDCLTWCLYGQLGAPGDRMYERNDVVTDEIGRTAYEQVVNSLRGKIERRELGIGDPIPSTAKLCEEYGISTTVARRAVAELRAADLVVGKPGKGVFVSATPEDVAERMVDLEGLARQVGELRNELEEVRSARDRDLSGEVARLRRQVGLIHTHLIDLYGRLGQSYPYESLAEFENANVDQRGEGRSATGT